MGEDPAFAVFTREQQRELVTGKVVALFAVLHAPLAVGIGKKFPSLRVGDADKISESGVRHPHGKVLLRPTDRIELNEFHIPQFKSRGKRERVAVAGHAFWVVGMAVDTSGSPGSEYYGVRREREAPSAAPVRYGDSAGTSSAGKYLACDGPFNKLNATLFRDPHQLLHESAAAHELVLRGGAGARASF